MKWNTLLGCPIPVLDDPNDITIPSQKQDDSLLRNLSYVIEDKAVKTNSNLVPLFGGYQNWKQREDSFKLKPAMKVTECHELLFGN